MNSNFTSNIHLNTVIASLWTKVMFSSLLYLKNCEVFTTSRTRVMDFLKSEKNIVSIHTIKRIILRFFLFRVGFSIFCDQWKKKSAVNFFEYFLGSFWMGKFWLSLYIYIICSYSYYSCCSCSYSYYSCCSYYCHYSAVVVLVAVLTTMLLLWLLVCITQVLWVLL